MGRRRGRAARSPASRPTASLDRTIDVPADFVSSLCFGGDDMRDVYVTTIGCLAARALRRAGPARPAGHRLAAARFDPRSRRDRELRNAVRAREGLKALEERTRYDPTEVEPRVLREVAGGGLLPRRAGGLGRRELLDRDPAAQRDGRAAHGPRAQRQRPGHPDPLQPHERPAHEVDLRHRPRRHRDAGPGREAAGLRGHEQGGDRARGRSTGACGSGASSTAARSSSSSSAWAPRATTSTSASRSTSATSRRSMKVFVDLYDKGLIYRDNYMVNWDPGTRSAISDLEVEDREVTRHPLLHRRTRSRMAAARLPSPPSAPRRCSPTPPSR